MITSESKRLKRQVFNHTLKVISRSFKNDVTLLEKIHINVSIKLTGMTGGTGIFQRQLQ